MQWMLDEQPSVSCCTCNLYLKHNLKSLRNGLMPHRLAGQLSRYSYSTIPFKSLQAKIGTLPGDILLISSFLSYVGCFTRRYREELQHKMWLPSFCKMDVSACWCLSAWLNCAHFVCATTAPDTVHSGSRPAGAALGRCTNCHLE